MFNTVNLPLCCLYLRKLAPTIKASCKKRNISKYIHTAKIHNRNSLGAR